MRSSLRCLIALVALTLLLAACGGGGPKKRVFPPSASLQELTVARDGSWTLAVRVQNFSNVTQRIATVDAALVVGGQPAGTLKLAPDMMVGPESVEIFSVSVTPPAAAAAAVSGAIDARRSVRYELNGSIASTEPSKRRDAFTFDSQLTPVPGLTGVLR